LTAKGGPPWAGSRTKTNSGAPPAEDTSDGANVTLT